MNGWLILDKPVGLGSTQAVSAVKRALRDGGYGKCKVGHGGTLDPLASGVLPIAIGEATKLAGRLLDGDKDYAFTIRFGEETDTLDAEGVVTETSDVRPHVIDVDTIVARFEGSIAQVPPRFSAIKIDGRRAYDMARAGKEPQMISRQVCVHHLILDATSGPHSAIETATYGAVVSKGTYIRSLARDIAHALGTVGHVVMLRRTKAGPFTLAQAITLDKLAELGHARAVEDNLLPLRAGLDDIPALSLTPDQAGALRQGRVLAGYAADDGQYFACADDVPVALVAVSDGKVAVVRGFNLMSRTNE